MHFKETTIFKTQIPAAFFLHQTFKITFLSDSVETPMLCYPASSVADLTRVQSANDSVALREALDPFTNSQLETQMSQPVHQCPTSSINNPLISCKCFKGVKMNP